MTAGGATWVFVAAFGLGIVVAITTARTEAGPGMLSRAGSRPIVRVWHR